MDDLTCTKPHAISFRRYHKLVVLHIKSPMESEVSHFESPLLKASHSPAFEVAEFAFVSVRPYELHNMKQTSRLAIDIRIWAQEI